MKTSRKELIEALARTLDKSRSSKQAARAIASYLIAERRTGELDSLLRDLEAKHLKDRGTLEVHATSAFPLTDSIKKQIKKLFEAENIVIHEQHDKNIIGGVKVRALDKVADFSVQARLRQLRSGKGV